MTNLPSISDCEEILREKPDLRSQVSTRGVLNSALPDALRIKREAIELRKKLAESKAELEAYQARKEQQQKALADSQKTLDALKASRAKTSPAKPAAVVAKRSLAMPASPKAKTLTRAEFDKLAHADRNRFFREKGKLI